VLRALSLCACCRHYPGTATGGVYFARFPPSYQPSPKGWSGRPVHRPFRGLLSVHSRYGLHTCWITLRDPLHQRLQPVRHLPDCSDCFRPERCSRVGLAPTGKTPPYHGAHPTPSLPLPSTGVRLPSHDAQFSARQRTLRSRTNLPCGSKPSSPTLLGQLRARIRVKHYGIRTEVAYVDWVRRFIVFHNKRHPRHLGAAEVEAFLTYLADKRQVSASTQIASGRCT
jgi:hypothetical protein